MRPRPATPPWPSASRQLFVLAGLTGFAISQPILGLLGDEPTILARHGIEGWDLVLLGLTIAFVPPLVLWGITRVAAAVDGQLKSPVRLDRAIHLLFVGALVGCFTIQVAKSAGGSGPVVLLLAAGLIGGGFVIAYVRTRAVPTWASYTAILPVLAVTSLLVTSPASALLTSASAPERVEGAGDLPSVVFIILDELPTRSLLDGDDNIDAQRFPNLAAFAQDATWYRHHTTLATLTEAAVPSMLTGSVPETEEAVWTSHPDNLFTLLAPTHELEVIEQGTELCPYDVCAPITGDGDGAAAALDVGGPGFGDLLGVARDLWVERVSLGEERTPDFDDFDEAVTSADATTSTTVDATSPSTTARPDVEDRPTYEEAQTLTSTRANALVESFDRAKGPALYYLHLMIPHQPFKRYPDGTEYGVVDPLGVGLPEVDHKVRFSWSPWISAVNEQQHLLQVQYGDRIVGQILDGLRDKGLYDKSLVVVAADHGISFEERTPGRYVEPSTIDAMGYAPLFVKAPRQTEGAVDDANLMSFDLLPTIADLVGVDVTWETDGASAGSDEIAERGTRKQIFDMMGFGGLRIERVLEFDDAEEFVTVGDRSIGALGDPDDPLSALHQLLGIEGLVGRQLDDVVTGQRDGSVGLDALAELRDPGDPPTMGLVTGDVSSASDDARLVLAVDGVVVGGSALSTDSDGRAGRIAVLLPQDALDAHNDIRAALVEEDGEVRELEVRSL